MVQTRLDIDKGFIGCVRKLEINSRNFDFRSGVKGDALDGADIGESQESARLVCAEYVVEFRQLKRHSKISDSSSLASFAADL